MKSFFVLLLTLGLLCGCRRSVPQAEQFNLTGKWEFHLPNGGLQCDFIELSNTIVGTSSFTNPNFGVYAVTVSRLNDHVEISYQTEHVFPKMRFHLNHLNHFSGTVKADTMYGDYDRKVVDLNGEEIGEPTKNYWIAIRTSKAANLPALDPKVLNDEAFIESKLADVAKEHALDKFYGIDPDTGLRATAKTMRAVDPDTGDVIQDKFDAVTHK